MARALERGAGSEVLLTDPVYLYYTGKTTMLGGSQQFVVMRRANSTQPMSERP